MVDHRLTEIAIKLGISCDEIKEALRKMGEAGIKGAEAGKKLGIEMRKYEKRNNEKTKLS